MYNLNWAICLDIGLLCGKLFQRVVQYETNTPNMVTISFSGETYHTSTDKIREIEPPKFTYGDVVSPVNHPDMIGYICGIIYHASRNEPVFYIRVNGKMKSKRYFADDLAHK